MSQEHEKEENQIELEWKVKEHEWTWERIALDKFKYFQHIFSIAQKFLVVPLSYSGSYNVTPVYNRISFSYWDMQSENDGRYNMQISFHLSIYKASIEKSSLFYISNAFVKNLINLNSQIHSFFRPPWW